MNVRHGIQAATLEEYSQIVAVWEASVRATHHFISEADIIFFRPLVCDGLPEVEHLFCKHDQNGGVIGFIGVEAQKIEMLFIRPDWFGQGIGRELLQYAVHTLAAMAVDVNEQNTQAVGFYEHLGFVVNGRSELDSTNKPYPILHMVLRN